jgi:hypothetical protein
MSKQNNGQNDNTFPEKFLKKLPDGFTDTANAMKDDELKKTIFECEGNIYVIDREKEGDDKLNGAKEIVKDHAAPYRDAKACQMAKIKYALYLLEGRGVDLDKQ